MEPCTNQIPKNKRKKKRKKNIEKKKSTTELFSTRVGGNHSVHSPEGKRIKKNEKKENERTWYVYLKVLDQSHWRWFA